MFNSKVIKLFNYTVDYLSYRIKLGRCLNINIRSIKKLYLELYQSVFFKEIKYKTGSKGNFFDLSMLNPIRAPVLYVTCRVIKPEFVVETGVANGFSTSFILKALEENKKGRLFSIDLPNQPGEEIEDEVGWLVPKNLKSRWNLIIGLSKERLSDLLKELKSIDIFYHDSDHSYENMSYELETTWDFVKKNGFLICDDVNTSSAFTDFCFKKKCENVKIFRLGITRRC